MRVIPTLVLVARLVVNQATVVSTRFDNTTINGAADVFRGTTVLTVGLHSVDCQLFVSGAAPTEVVFKVEFLLNNAAYPTLSTRQLLRAPDVVHYEGTIPVTVSVL